MEKQRLLIITVFLIFETIRSGNQATATIKNSPRMLGGTLSNFAEFPYLAYIWFDAGSNRYNDCPAVLVSLEHILFAIACIPPTIINAKVIVGTNDPDWDEITRQEINITVSSLTDEDYANKHPNGLLMILKLPTILSQSQAVNIISVGDYRVFEDNEPNFYYVSYSWLYRVIGPTRSSGDTRLMKLNTVINTRAFCMEQLVPETELCTGTIKGGIGVCSPEGGMLIKKSNENPEPDELFGILKTGGIPCCGIPRCFNTFIDLTNDTYKMWINQAVG